MDQVVVKFAADTSKLDAAGLASARKMRDLFEKKGLQLNVKTANLPLGRITGDFDKFSDSLDAAASRVLAFTATTTAVYGVSAAFVRLFTDSIALEKQLASLQSILQTTTSNLKQFQNELFAIANATGQSFDIAAKAAEEFARQGLSVQDTIKATSAALTFSKIAGVDAAQSVETLTSALNTFNNEALDYTEIVDTIATLDTNFSVSAAGIADGLKRIGSVASEAGIDLKEIASLISVVQQVSARGAPVISNGLKTIFTRLNRSGVQDALENIGVKTKDSNGEFRSQISVLTDLANTFDSLTDSQKSFILEQVGGVYQINTLQSTLKTLRGEYSLFDKAVNIASESSGSAAVRLKILTETTSASLQSLQNNVKQFLAEVGNVTVKPIADNFIGFANSIFEPLNKLLSGSDLKDSGEELGATIGKGVLRGIGAALSGPGIILVGFTLGKLLTSLAKDALKALQVLSGLKKASLVDSDAQKAVNLAISTGNKALVERLKTTNDIIARTQILNTLLSQSAVRQQELQINALIATGLTQSSKKVARGGKAAGFIPNFSDSGVGQVVEDHGAKEHGYKAGKAYTTRIHDGRGRSYLSYVNDAETVKTVRNSEGKLATFVIPPNGFGKGTTYASSGFVPNFAKNVEEAPGVKVKKLKEEKPLRDSIGNRLKRWASLDTDSTISNLTFRDPDTGESTSFSDVISDFTNNKGLSDKEARDYVDWLGRAAELNPSIRDVVSDIRYTATRPNEQKKSYGFFNPIQSVEQGPGYYAAALDTLAETRAVRSKEYGPGYSVISGLEKGLSKKKFFNQGFVPNFVGFRQIGISRPGDSNKKEKSGSSFLDYIELGDVLKLDFINSPVRGDGYKMFRKLVELSIQKGLPITSDVLLKQLDEKDNLKKFENGVSSGASNYNLLKLIYPQLRYREIDGLSTSGVIRYSPASKPTERKSTLFNSLGDLEQIVEGADRRTIVDPTGGRFMPGITDLYSQFSKRPENVQKFLEENKRIFAEAKSQGAIFRDRKSVFSNKGFVPNFQPKIPKSVLANILRTNISARGGNKTTEIFRGQGTTEKPFEYFDYETITGKNPKDVFLKNDLVDLIKSHQEASFGDIFLSSPEDRSSPYLTYGGDLETKIPFVSTSLNKEIAKANTTDRLRDNGKEAVYNKKIRSSRIFTVDAYRSLARYIGEKEAKEFLYKHSKQGKGKGIGFDVNSFYLGKNLAPTVSFGEEEIALLNKGFVPNFAFDKKKIRSLIKANRSNFTGEKAVTLYRGTSNKRDPFAQYDFSSIIPGSDPENVFYQNDIYDHINKHRNKPLGQAYSSIRDIDGKDFYTSAEKEYLKKKVRVKYKESLPFISTSLDKRTAERFANTKYDATTRLVASKSFRTSRIVSQSSYEKLVNEYGQATIDALLLKLTKIGKGRGLGFDFNSFQPESDFTDEKEIGLLSTGFVPNLATPKFVSDQILRPGYNESYLQYKQKKDALDIGFTQSSKKGDAFALFSRLVELSATTGVPIKSGIIVRQRGEKGYDVNALKKLFEARGKDFKSEFPLIQAAGGSVQNLDFLSDDEKAQFKTVEERLKESEAERASNYDLLKLYYPQLRYRELEGLQTSGVFEYNSFKSLEELRQKAQMVPRQKFIAEKPYERPFVGNLESVFTGNLAELAKRNKEIAARLKGEGATIKRVRSKSSGFIPNFAKSKRSEIVRGNIESFLKYYRDKKAIDVGYMKGSQRGDAFNMFSRLVELSARSGVPITSHTLVEQRGSDGYDQGALRQLLSSKGLNSRQILDIISDGGSVKHLDFLTDDEKGRFKTIEDKMRESMSAGASNYDLLKLVYPQIRYREIKGLKTSGNIQFDKSFDFGSLDELKDITNNTDSPEYLNPDEYYRPLIGDLTSVFQGDLKDLIAQNRGLFKKARGEGAIVRNRYKGYVSGGFMNKGFVPNFRFDIGDFLGENDKEDRIPNPNAKKEFAKIPTIDARGVRSNVEADDKYSTISFRTESIPIPQELYDKVAKETVDDKTAQAFEAIAIQRINATKSGAKFKPSLAAFNKRNASVDAYSIDSVGDKSVSLLEVKAGKWDKNLVFNKFGRFIPENLFTLGNEFLPLFTENVPQEHDVIKLNNILAVPDYGVSKTSLGRRGGSKQNKETGEYGGITPDPENLLAIKSSVIAARKEKERERERAKSSRSTQPIALSAPRRLVMPTQTVGAFERSTNEAENQLKNLPNVSSDQVQNILKGMVGRGRSFRPSKVKASGFIPNFAERRKKLLIDRGRFDKDSYLKYSRDADTIHFDFVRSNRDGDAKDLVAKLLEISSKIKSVPIDIGPLLPQDSLLQAGKKRGYSGFKLLKTTFPQLKIAKLVEGITASGLLLGSKDGQRATFKFNSLEQLEKLANELDQVDERTSIGGLSMRFTGDREELIKRNKENRSARILRNDSIKIKPNNPYSQGFVPNFSNALEDAKNREMAAGYSASQIRVGYSRGLVTPLNPKGMGVYNSDEGSLTKGISLAKQAGIDPKTKGAKAAGHIPNFAPKSSLSSSATSPTTPAEKITNAVTQGITSAKKLTLLYEELNNAVKKADKALEDKMRALIAAEEDRFNEQKKAETGSPLGGYAQRSISSREKYLEANPITVSQAVGKRLPTTLPEKAFIVSEDANNKSKKSSKSSRNPSLSATTPTSPTERAANAINQGETSGKKLALLYEELNNAAKKADKAQESKIKSLIDAEERRFDAQKKGAYGKDAKAAIAAREKYLEANPITLSQTVAEGLSTKLSEKAFAVSNIPDNESKADKKARIAQEKEAIKQKKMERRDRLSTRFQFAAFALTGIGAALAGEEENRTPTQKKLANASNAVGSGLSTFSLLGGGPWAAVAGAGVAIAQFAKQNKIDNVKSSKEVVDAFEKNQTEVEKELSNVSTALTKSQELKQLQKNDNASYEDVARVTQELNDALSNVADVNLQKVFSDPNASESRLMQAVSDFQKRKQENLKFEGGLANIAKLTENAAKERVTFGSSLGLTSAAPKKKIEDVSAFADPLLSALKFPKEPSKELEKALRDVAKNEITVTDLLKNFGSELGIQEDLLPILIERYGNLNNEFDTDKLNKYIAQIAQLNSIAEDIKPVKSLVSLPQSNKLFDKAFENINRAAGTKQRIGDIRTTSQLASKEREIDFQAEFGNITKDQSIREKTNLGIQKIQQDANSESNALLRNAIANINKELKDQGIKLKPNEQANFLDLQKQVFNGDKTVLDLQKFLNDTVQASDTDREKISTIFQDTNNELVDKVSELNETFESRLQELISIDKQSLERSRNESLNQVGQNIFSGEAAKGRATIQATDFKQIANLETEVKKLEEKLQKTSDPAERNKIFAQIAGKNTELLRLQTSLATAEKAAGGDAFQTTKAEIQRLNQLEQRNAGATEVESIIKGINKTRVDGRRAIFVKKEIDQITSDIRSGEGEKALETINKRLDTLNDKELSGEAGRLFKRLQEVGGTTGVLKGIQLPDIKIEAPKGIAQLKDSVSTGRNSQIAIDLATAQYKDNPAMKSYLDVQGKYDKAQGDFNTAKAALEAGIKSNKLNQGEIDILKTNVEDTRQVALKAKEDLDVETEKARPLLEKSKYYIEKASSILPPTPNLSNLVPKESISRLDQLTRGITTTRQTSTSLDDEYASNLSARKKLADDVKSRIASSKTLNADQQLSLSQGLRRFSEGDNNINEGLKKELIDAAGGLSNFNQVLAENTRSYSQSKTRNEAKLSEQTKEQSDLISTIQELTKAVTGFQDAQKDIINMQKSVFTKDNSSSNQNIAITMDITGTSLSKEQLEEIKTQWLKILEEKIRNAQNGKVNPPKS